LLVERGAFGELPDGSTRKGTSATAEGERNEGFWPLLAISELLADLFGVFLLVSFVPMRKGVLADFRSSLCRANQFDRCIMAKKTERITKQ